MPRAVLWMRLPNLPDVCCNERALAIIVASAGTLVHLDNSTSLLAKEQFARVAIQVDVCKHFVPGTDIEIEGGRLATILAVF